MRYTFEQAEERFLNAIQWIEDQGISTQRTRFGKYLKRLKVNNLGDEQSSRFFFNALLEINELCDIHNGFRNMTMGKDFKQKLRMFCDGPEEYFKEGKKKNNYARDYGFELAIASQFASNGFPVQTSLETADVSTSFEGKQWLIECKRPRKKTSVRANTRDAYSQLKRGFRNSTDPSFGVVAISMTKAATGDLLIAYNASPKQAKAIAMDALEEIVSEYAKQLRKLDNWDKNIVGLIFRLIQPYWDFNVNEYGTYTGHSLVTFYPDGTEEIEAYRSIARILSGEDLEVKQYR